MFRSALETAIRCIKRGIPSFKQNGLQVSRQVSNLHNATVPFNVIQSESVGQLSYRSFFFGHWLKMTSYSARFRCNPVYRMVANKRNSSFYLAFIGLGYLGQNNDSNSSNFPKLDVNLDNWLQTGLKEAVKRIPNQFETCEGKKLKDFEICDRLGKPSSNSAVYAAKCHDNKYAIKMLFNFAANSHSHSLHQAFLKELTVLSSIEGGDETNYEQENPSQYKILPRHHNIMKVVGSFADIVPKLHDSVDSYPAALPFHYNGYGRNRTLFLIMPRFSSTLSEYVTNHDLSERTSLALFTQLLEGLVHLTKNGVVHRDLKGDNLLVNETTAEGLPHLVITDFDCCLAEKHFDFKMPYETAETGKGGNIGLMPPEVVSAKPGPGHVIDYSKADEWSAGVLAYEIFGQQNPFENSTINKGNYENKDLPDITCAPKLMTKLVKRMLSRHPNDRPDITTAATVCQLLLWAPHLCIYCTEWNVEAGTVKRWLRSKTLGLAMEMMEYKVKENIPVEKQMLATFLSRSSVKEILQALEWIASPGKENY